MKKKELLEIAKRLEIKGRSKMSVEELEEAINEAENKPVVSTPREDQGHWEEDNGPADQSSEGGSEGGGTGAFGNTGGAAGPTTVGTTPPGL